ncbi:DUF6069 family protein [Micromonospora aurantiaca (nom. illeg.)]|uniref:Integral membrane protein n=1 Tax=Micromonospora aurantiaca (nom. illeg.) TaxID=47850 RepID=A0ABQ6UA31_9ACTN|nr:DUF6069 family protein [Micromonospora aurantiaca]KAB1107565.1 hypothetical protein F6X54_26100 [Micromonospora aurantiaca]UFN97297.1 DUF6069 family protein [Micromonospora aurantiaca]
MPARTLALPGGARVPVVAAQWRHAYGVVTRGRVQLELRDGTPGPVLGRDAGFWLRGTGVRALRNPGRRTATVRILTPGSWRNDMISSTDTGVTVGRPHGFRRLAVTGLVATIAAMAVTTLAAALARAAGVDFEIPDGGETIPLGGFAVVTGFFSLVGVVIAAVLLRFSAHPARRFVWTAVSLTALSMVPPFIAGGDAATTVTLAGLHLVAAAVMIPALTRSLRADPSRGA